MFMQLNKLESKEHFLGMMPPGMVVTVVCIEQVRPHPQLRVCFKSSNRHVPWFMACQQWENGLANSEERRRHCGVCLRVQAFMCVCVYVCMCVCVWVWVCAQCTRGQMKMNMLAMSCVCPAVVTLVSNLIVSDDSTPSEEDPLWLQNYDGGKGFEVYRTNLSPNLYGMCFIDVAKVVYHETSAVRRWCLRYGSWGTGPQWE